MLVPEARGNLPFLSWNDVPSTVLVPRWRQVAAAQEVMLAGMTVAGAGPAATDAQVAATLTDAVAVALIDAGGEVHVRLGEPYGIDIGGTRIEPWRELSAIADGSAAPPGWVGRCVAAGVGDLPLARA
jgi:hypothetical protein